MFCLRGQANKSGIGSYLAVKAAACPRLLHTWDMLRLRRSAIIKDRQ